MRLFSVAVALILAAQVLHADVVSLKDGSVIECKVVDQTIKNGKQVMIVELEDGSKKTIQADKIGWVARAKPSWEVRKANKAWYEKELSRREKKLETKWKEHESLARVCKRKKYLDEKTEFHFTKAYEMRQPEIKDSIKGHEKVAKWLEKTCGLFDLATKEWDWSFRARKKELEAEGELKAKDWTKLGQWAEKRNLFDQAKSCYEQGLVIEPDNKTALKGMERIKQLQETLINPKLFRTIKDSFGRAVAAFKKKQEKDGSYGGDVPVCGVQGHRAMTSLAALALIGEWEFSTLENPQAAKTVPKELAGAINFLTSAPVNKKRLRGYDCWGSIFVLKAFAKILEKRSLKKFHSAVKTKTGEIMTFLAQNQGPDGGWSYYHFAKKTSGAFLSGPYILNFLSLKKSKVKIDQGLYDRALGHLQKMKQSDGVWMYRTTVKQKVEGCQGRSMVCELALYKSGKGSKQAIQLSADNFFKYRHILEAVKGKRGTHIGTGSTAPYYFLYGHMFFAEAVKVFDDATRDKYQSKMRDLFLKDQESDGSFSDWPMAKLHKLYGAMMGAVTLYHVGTVEKKETANARR